ncbi:MAG: hypothetical protein LBG76_05290 [Treponema sp.]|jgi:hypothetical protein|nr:hypothetical protein [Treponema sp.]
MDTFGYLEALPLNRIVKYRGPFSKDGFPFTGFMRQHPSEKNKLILIDDPLGETPRILEFKLEDILHAEEVPQAVTQSGEGVPLVKLWIRRGARGMILEPFVVGDSPA